MINIVNRQYLGEEAIIMESSRLKAVFLPGIGFKLASLQYKPKCKELLFQPAKGCYDKPEFGAPFENYDTSGCDDMLPTIDACPYPGTEFKGTWLPDHGEVWSRKWDWSLEEDHLQAKIDLTTLPLTLLKTLKFDSDNRLLMQYRLINNSDKPVEWLWALHSLNALDEEVELITPQGCDSVLNVKNSPFLGDSDTELSYPGDLQLNKLSLYPDKQFFKFYYTDVLHEGLAGLHYKNSGLSLLIGFDPEKMPYLGVWINKGGFKNECNVAVEMCNGFYDSLEIAHAKKRVAMIGPKAEFHWEISMTVKEAGL